MDVDRKKAIITWINCLQIGPEIGDLRELHDGRHFVSLLKIMKPESDKDKFILKNWATFMKNFLEEHYDVGLQDDLDFAAAELKNELELAKISILVLCASVHCNGKAQFVNKIVKLDLKVQELIKSIIEGVVAPSGTTLCHDFDKVLKVTDSSSTVNCADLPCMRIQQEKPRDCTIYCNDVEDGYSPIKQCFQTPQLASWSAIKEKEIEMHKLKGELEAERTMRSYLESDMQNLKKENGKLSVSIETLKITTRDLTEKCNSLKECQSLLAKTELNFQKLQARCEEHAKIVFDYPSLEMAFKTQAKENRSLEEQLDQLQKKLKASQKRVTELNQLEDTVQQLTATLCSRDHNIDCLKVTTKSQESELQELRQINKEMTRLIENKSQRQDLVSGENMAVISNIIALENDIKRLHEEVLMKEKQIEKMLKTHAKEKSQLELELRNVNLKLQLSEDEVKAFKTNVQLLRDNISKMDVELTSVQELRNKEQHELNAMINQQKEDIECVHQELNYKNDRIKALETHESEMEKKYMALDVLKESLLAEKASIEGRFTSLSQDFLSKCTEFTSLQDTASALEEEIEKCVKESEAKNSRIDHLMTTNAETTAKYEELVKEKASLASELKTNLETRSQLELELRNVNLKLQRSEDEVQAFKADVQLLRDNLSKMGDELTSVQEQLIKEQHELNAVINQQMEDSELVHKELNDKNDRIKVLETHESEMEKKYTELDAVKESLVAEKATIEDRFTTLSQDFLSKCTEMTSLQETATAQEEEMKKCVKESVAKSSRIDQLMTTNMETTSKYDELVKEKASLVSELKTHLETCSQLELELRNVNLKLQHSEDEVKAVKADVQLLRDNLSKMSDELTSVQEQLIKEKRELNAVINQQMEDSELVHKELNDKNDRIKSLETHESEMEKKYTELDAAKETLVTEKASIEDRFTTLSQDFLSKCTEMTSLQETASALEEEIKKCVKESEAKSSRIDQLMTTNAETTAKYEELVKEKASLVSELKTHLETHSQLELELRNVNSKAQHSEDDLQSFKADVQLLRVNISKLDDKLVSVQEQRIKEQRELKAIINQQKEDIEFLQQELNDKNGRIKVLETHESEMETKYKALQAVKESLVAEKASNEDRLTSLSQDFLSKCTEMNSLRETASALEEEVNKCVNESEAKSSRIDQLMAMNVEITAKYEELIKEKVALVSETNSNRDKLKRLSALESQSAVREQNQEGMLRKCMELTTENGDLKIDIQQLKSQLDRQNDFLSKQKECTEQIASMQAQIRDAEKRHLNVIRCLKEDKQSIADKYEKANGLLKENSDQLRAKNEELEKYNSQLESFKEHYRVSQESLASLTTENSDLKMENQQLRSKLERQNDFFSKQKEFTEQVAAMQGQIQDAEKRHFDIIRSMKEENQSLTDKYEKAKDMLKDLSDQLQAKEDEHEKGNSQLESFKEHYQASRDSLTKVMSLNKNAEHEKTVLQERLHKEFEKTAQQAAHIKKLESVLNQLQKSRHPRHSFSDDAFIKPQQVEHQTRGNPRRPSITVTYNSAESYNVMFDDQHQNSLLSINADPQDIKMDNKFALSRAIVPPGASNYFPCEDEEGELLNFSYLVGQNADHKDMPSKNVFVQPPHSSTSSSRLVEDQDGAFSNFSYLNDLKNGRCELPNESGRLSELQRRNTLCLPHLKTSYPVEMQSQTMISFTDEDFKTGKLDVTGLSQISAIHGDQPPDLTYDTLGAKKKFTKPIQPTYQKPGPPTPGKSSKSGHNKPGKTPSSLKRLLHRTHFRTPKGTAKAKVTPKKNRENQPPEPNQGPRPRRNLAFTIGLSPKVKSHPKSLAISKKTSTPKK